MENAGIQRVVRGVLRDRDDDAVPVAPEITDGLVRQERAIPVNDEAEIPTARMFDLDVVSIDHDWHGSRVSARGRVRELSVPAPFSL